LENLEIRIDFLREQGGLYGVSVAAVEEEVKNAFSENCAYLIKGDIDQHKVVVTVKEEVRRFVDDLSSLYIRASNGDLTSFQSVAAAKKHLGPISVSHINRMCSVTLYFNLRSGFAIDEAVEFIKARAQGFPPAIGT
jgi:HAE1 family hydrophobic/amphiphilic exporter-1